MNDDHDALREANRLLERGRAHHHAGRLGPARALYEDALRRAPSSAEALHLLGAVDLQERRFEAAAGRIRRAIALGAATADGWYNLGLALAAQREWPGAADAFSNAVRLRPDFVPARRNLAGALRGAGRLRESRAAYERALALAPGDPDTLHDAGAVLEELGEPAAALTLHERALRLAPRDPAGCLYAGNAHRALGRDAPAEAAYRRAVAIDPGFAPAWNALGLVLRERGDVDAALDAYRRGVAADPRSAELHNNLGVALKAAGALGEAIASFERALALDPGAARVRNNIADTLQHQGRIDEAIAMYRTAVESEPVPAIHSGLYFCRHYDPAFDEAGAIAEARRWDRIHAAPLAPAALDFPHDRSPDRRLRVGYLSADLCRHPVGFFVGPVIEAHDRERFEVFCYAGVEQPDDLTARIAATADHWREVGALDDDAVAARIREDRIDVLAELGAHTRGHRLLVLARRPAPVQVIAGGHFDTSGLSAADYLIADAAHAPPGSDGAFAETPVRLPDGYVCYRPPEYAPAVAAPPFARNRHVTFGCFSRVQKATRFIAGHWCEILRRTPGSRLRLQAREWDDPPTRARYRAFFAERGVGEDRVDLVGGLAHDALLAEYAAVDLVLDTYPYSGGLTTCEALWMGVPVVTLAGPTFAGRHSTGHLRNVGLGELATSSAPAYVALAVALARDPARLAGLRRGLRERVAASPLCDRVRYTAHLEAAYREMWRRWVSG